MEKTNFRYVTKENFDEEIDFYCCDVSFISLDKILGPLSEIVSDDSFGVMLIKPQFESEKEEVIKGKVNDFNIHIKDINKVFEFAIQKNFSIKKLSFSPILGNKKKNIEYLMLIEKNKNPIREVSKEQVNVIVSEAWKYFKDSNEK